jgi:nucleoside-diphosphate-sugar epimerase
MRVMVIGGTGFSGPHVVRRLHAMGHRLTLFHRGQTRAELPPDVEEIEGDREELRANAERLRALRPDVVLHMFAMAERHGRDLVETFRGFARRVVVISSQDVYLPYGRLWKVEPGPPVPMPLTEDGPLRTVLFPHKDATSPIFRKWRKELQEYDKILVERAVMGDPALPGTVVRLPAVHGPGDPGHRLFDLLKRMDDGRPAILLDERAARWRWSRGYVEDVAHAITLAVADERAAGRIYNVAWEEALPMTEWVRRVGEAAGWRGEVVALPTEQLPAHLVPETDPSYDWVVDTARIRRELGYAEVVPFEEALRRTVEWERANPPAEVDPAKFDYGAEDRALAGSAPGP